MKVSVTRWRKTTLDIITRTQNWSAPVQRQEPATTAKQLEVLIISTSLSPNEFIVCKIKNGYSLAIDWLSD